MLLAILCVVIFSIEFMPRFSSISIPADVSGQRQPGNRETELTVGTVPDIEWEPVKAGKDNPFLSDFLAWKFRKAEEKENIKGAKDVKKEEGNQEPTQEPKQESEFITRKIKALYRGIMTRTDGTTIAMLEIRPNRIITLRKGDTFADNIRVMEFSRTQMTLKLPDNQQAILKPGKNTRLEYKIPRKND